MRDIREKLKQSVLHPQASTKDGRKANLGFDDGTGEWCNGCLLHRQIMFSIPAFFFEEEPRTYAIEFKRLKCSAGFVP